MAVEPATNATDSGDIQAHVRDYSRFTWLLKWGAVGSFIIAMIVVVLISN